MLGKGHEARRIMEAMRDQNANGPEMKEQKEARKMRLKS